MSPHQKFFCPGTAYNNNIPVTDLLNAFLGAPGAGATTSGHGTVTVATINNPTNTAGINSMMTQQTNQNNAASTRPKAFINVIFFDEQFKAVDYRISMVGDNNELKNHYSDLQNIVSQKNGYVYIGPAQYKNALVPKSKSNPQLVTLSEQFKDARVCEKNPNCGGF